jgi:hypothetical protein
MTSHQPVRRHCAVCGVREEKPNVALSQCRTHHELRCKACSADGKHNMSTAQLFAHAGDAVFKIQSILNEKEEDGETMVLVRWADTWMKKSVLINQAELQQPNSLDALVDAAVTATDADGNYFYEIIIN